jgi:CubicO group peptidase (beta-lactamase class C family)
MRIRLFAILALGIGAASCRPAEPSSLMEASSPLDTVVPAILEKDHIPAAVIVAGDVDKITYRKAFGGATLDTIFDLASCTKVVGTTTAVMKLVEEGKLSLDDPVGKVLPAFREREISIRDLLEHRSGLPAYLTPRSRTPDGILEEIAAQKRPKTFQYSCLNMISLARVVETVTGVPIAEYLQKEVFGPLGMKDTGYWPPAGRCAPTSWDPPGKVHDPLARAYTTPEHQSGNAGLFSTADDLAIFCRALLTGKIHKPETVGLMFRPNMYNRGLGWEVCDEVPYRPGVRHSGYTGTLLWIQPERRRFVIVLTNRVFPDDKAHVAHLRNEVLSFFNN